MDKKRTVKGNKIQDVGAIANAQYNEHAGAQKQIDVGPVLKPLFDGTNYSTNAVAAKALPSAGRSLAVYNNAAAVGSVTVGDSTVTALAVGATDASGRVGIACPPNSWTYISCGEATHVIASAATLLVYLIDDDSSLVQQASR